MVEEENRQSLTFTFVMQIKSLAFKLIFFRHKSEQDHTDVCHGMKRAKEMLDKDSVFFWRLFQDIFKTSTINFTGISSLCHSLWLTIFLGLLVIPNVSNSVSEKIICKKDSDFALFRWKLYHLRIPNFITCRRHLESSKHFSDWCGRHLTTKKPLDHGMFVSVVTRLNGLYVLVETPQQNTDSGVEDEGGGEEVS